MAAMAAAPDCRMRPSTTTLALAAAATAATGRPIQDSVLGLSEIAWAGEFTHSSEGPLRGGCAASDSKADQAHCLGPSFYLGTPSVVRSPLTGHLLASADLFDHGPSAACWPDFFVAHRDKTWPKWKRNATLFRSIDNGTSWQRRGWVTEHYWSSLFAHAGAVYYFGVSNDSNGAVKLSRSIDDGLTWRQSVLRGGERYTTGATAVTFAQGRVWRAFEGGPKRASMMFSADAGADLLDPSAWQRTAPLEFNLSWIPSSFGPVEKPVQPWVEGNAVEGPDGRMYNLLRMESGWSKARPIANKAILLRVSHIAPAVVTATTTVATGGGDAAVTQESEEGSSRAGGGAEQQVESSKDAPPMEFVEIVDMPGGSSKFTVRRHQASGVYFALTNNVTNVSACASARNVLTLVSSRDLRTWTIVDTLIETDEGMALEDVWRYTSFSYVDWQFDGPDIIYAIRTSYRGGVSFHNTNRITYKKIEDFERYLEPTPPTPTGTGWQLP